jgi:radical SAM superfamily enzyme YgiQ (UPF0313 family)
MVRILLISPKRGRLFSDPELEKVFYSSEECRSRARIIYRWPELGLITIAALCPPEFEIQLVDEEVTPVPFDADVDLVAITALTPKAERAYQIAEAFRARGIHTAMGGPHASVMPQEAQGRVDTVFVGEAEDTWPLFLEDLAAGRPARRYTAPRLTDLTRSPAPRFDLIQAEHYKALPLETTRGCPHDCEFCSSTRLFGRRYRMKGVDQVLKEVETLKSHAPRKFLFFVDDNMFVNRKRSYELLEALIPYRIRWFVQTDISIAFDPKLLSLIAQAGCKEVLIGFESLSPENLRQVNKDDWKLRHLENYPEAIERIQGSGIAIYGSFVLGLDHDDQGVFARVRDFVEATHLMGFQILFQTPIPGTRVAQRMEQEGRLLPHNGNWGRFSTYQVHFRPARMSKEELEAGMRWLFNQVYSAEAFKRRKAYYVGIMRRLAKNSGLHETGTA